MAAKDNESVLITKVLQFLNANGYTAWRQPNRGKYDPSAVAARVEKLVLDLRKMPNLPTPKVKEAVGNCMKLGWRKEVGALKGVADIIGWDNQTGRWIAVEIKVIGDTIRPEQAAWLDNLKKSGGEVWVVSNYDSFVTGFNRQKTA